MDCQEIHSWTFTQLGGAYLDLAIAFLLLCGSTIAYTASRFLACFDISLPCPCSNGMFPVAQNTSAFQTSINRKYPLSHGYFEDKHEHLEGASFHGSSRKTIMAKQGRNTEEWSRRRSKSPDLRCLNNFGSNFDFVNSNYCAGMEKETSIEESSSERFGSDEIIDKSKAGIDEELVNKVERQLQVDYRDENAIRLLEQALEEEQAACSALYLELEKERSAAASAADEAMAMVLRLQEEKATVEMNAPQYKSMVEAKSAFNVEEMNLLKEMLLRREREIHFLQKEVKAYREIVVGNVQREGQRHDAAIEREFLKTHTDASVSQMEFPGLEWSDYVEFDEKGDSFETVNAVHIGSGEERATSVQEKMIVSPGTTLHSQHILERTTTSSRENQEHNNVMCLPEEVKQTSQRDTKGEDFTYCGNAADSGAGESCNPETETERHYYDVHVVSSQPNMSFKLQTDEDEHAQENIGAQKVVPEQHIVRSQTDTSLSLQLTNTSRRKVHNSLRRNSTSSIERLKIESEIGLVKEKIRIVQERRNKLNCCLDEKEMDKVQLQVLDDETYGLHKTRHLISPRTVARQSTLPPEFS